MVALIALGCGGKGRGSRALGGSRRRRGRALSSYCRIKRSIRCSRRPHRQPTRRAGTGTGITACRLAPPSKVLAEDPAAWWVEVTDPRNRVPRDRRLCDGQLGSLDLRPVIRKGRHPAGKGPANSDRRRAALGLAASHLRLKIGHSQKSRAYCARRAGVLPSLMIRGPI